MLMPNTKVDAGFQGTITLEIWAWHDVILPVGGRFVHFVLQKLASPSEPYRGNNIRANSDLHMQSKRESENDGQG